MVNYLMSFLHTYILLHTFYKISIFHLEMYKYNHSTTLDTQYSTLFVVDIRQHYRSHNEGWIKESKEDPRFVRPFCSSYISM